MARSEHGRLLIERSLDGETRNSKQKRLARSVTVNVAESPLGWLFSRGLISTVQFDAGERLRNDWERAQLAPRVTMGWDSAPIARTRGGSSPALDPTCSQLDARRRFDAALAEAGPGMSDILWRIVCSGEGMRDAETALGWPARAGRLVLTLALDRIARFYRIG
jgi:hypothetical protein